MKKIVFLAIAALIAMPFMSEAQSSGSSSSSQAKPFGKPKPGNQAHAFSNVVGDAVPEGRLFCIQSNNNMGRNHGGYWDVPGHPNNNYKNGMNIQSWDFDNGMDRQYRFEKIPGERYYRIFVGTSNTFVVDLKGGTSKNGQNIHVWTKNNSDAQKFYFKKQFNGTYKIYHISGRLICLSGRSSKNGSNVHLWDDHDGPWVEWALIDPATKRMYK